MCTDDRPAPTRQLSAIDTLRARLAYAALENAQLRARLLGAELASSYQLTDDERLDMATGRIVTKPAP